MTQVEIYFNNDAKSAFTESAAADLFLGLRYISDKTGKAAAKEAFHISNCPYESLNEQEQGIRILLKGRSLSVGDIVTVMNIKDALPIRKHYLCCEEGWKEIDR